MDILAQAPQAGPTGPGPLAAAVRTACAWCQRLISEGALLDGRVSHGIYAGCRDQLRGGGR